MSVAERCAALLARADVARLLGLLGSGGEEARIVGGAVRNTLLGLPPGDIDITTTVLPEAVMQRAEDAGIKAVPTGIAHGTVTLVVDHVPFEITTLREDVETDGRHARVVFTRAFDKDAARRDFTVNAMSLGADGRLHDYFGGQTDLAAGRIRFIGVAAERIAEDYLRALRFFRFAALYGRGGLDAEGFAAVIAAREGLRSLSKERVLAELWKLLSAPDPSMVVEALAQSGLFGILTGGVPLTGSLRRMVLIEQALGTVPDPVRRLAALSVLVREDAERLRECLRLSNDAFRRLDGIGHGWRMADPAAGENAAKALLYAAGPRGFRDRVLVGFARSGQGLDDAAWRNLVALPERWQAPTFPVSGDDLALRGMLRGPDMGETLARIKALWFEAGLPVDQASIAALITRGMAGPL